MLQHPYIYMGVNYSYITKSSLMLGYGLSISLFNMGVFTCYYSYPYHEAELD